MTSCIEAQPRAGFNPLTCACPCGGTPLIPNYSPGFQPRAIMFIVIFFIFLATFAY